MYLSFESKEEILDSFLELEKHRVNNDRVNYKYKGKVIALQLSKTTGNGYINATYIGKEGCKSRVNGWTKISNYSPNELKELVDHVIKSFDKFYKQ